MNSIKCSNCGLANFEGAEHCRRCSSWLHHSRAKAGKTRRPRRYSFISLALYAALIYGGYHLYHEAKRNIEEVSTNEAYHVGTQVPQKPRETGITRNEQDRRHAAQVGITIKDSPSLQAKRKQEEETQRAMRQASGGQ